MEIGLQVRDVWEEGRCETVQLSLDCSRRAGRGLAASPARIALSTCPTAHCPLGEGDMGHAVPWTAGLLHWPAVVWGSEWRETWSRTKPVLVAPMGP